MTEENTISWTPILAKLFVLILLTGLPSTGILALLIFAGLVPITWIGPTLLITGSIFFIGASVLLATKNIHYWAYSLLLGLAAGIGCIVIAFLEMLLYISVPVVGNAAWLVVISLFIFFSVSTYLWDRNSPVIPKEIPVVTTASKTIGRSSPSYTPRRRKSLFMSSVELIEIPRDYAFSEDKKHSISEMNERFHSVVRHLTLSLIPFALRFQRTDWKTRILFLTWSKDEDRLHHYQTVLLDTLSSNLPGFKFNRAENFTGISLEEQNTGSAVAITGVPLSIEEETQRKDPLEAMTNILQELENGLFQVTVFPTKIDRSKLRSLESKYRKAVEWSETTVSKTTHGFLSGEQQESKNIINPKRMRLAESLKRQVERLSNPYLCKVWVTAASWGQDIATTNLDSHRIASALVGTNRPDNKMEEFQLVYKKKRKDIDQVLNGIAIGKFTTLTPNEATAFFTLPRTDVGIRVTTREKFSSGTVERAVSPKKGVIPQNMITTLARSDLEWLRRPPEIYFGNPLDEKGNLLTNLYVTLDPNRLDMHLGIFGNTRFGKTSTSLSLVGQAITLGINPIVLMPSKGYEWRKLIDFFPDLRVFTCGNDDAALFSINIWDPPEGVPLTKWIDRVVQALTLWLPSDEPHIAMHLELLVKRVYKNCGWDLKTKTKGTPIFLSDLVDGISQARYVAG
ncbi:MAG: hypothetical protein ACTSWQ_05715 [Candidatus Thorarchaeota archaeon]